MAIRFHCPRCGQPIEVPEEYTGGSGKCAECGSRLRIPRRVHCAGPQNAGNLETTAKKRKSEKPKSKLIIPEDSRIQHTGDDSAEGRIVKIVVTTAVSLVVVIASVFVWVNHRNKTARLNEAASLRSAFADTQRRVDSLKQRFDFENAARAVSTFQGRVDAARSSPPDLRHEFDTFRADFFSAKSDYEDKVAKGWQIFEGEFVAPEEKQRIVAAREDERITGERERLRRIEEQRRLEAARQAAIEEERRFESPYLAARHGRKLLMQDRAFDTFNFDLAFTEIKIREEYSLPPAEWQFLYGESADPSKYRSLNEVPFDSMEVYVHAFIKFYHRTHPEWSISRPDGEEAAFYVWYEGDTGWVAKGLQMLGTDQWFLELNQGLERNALLAGRSNFDKYRRHEVVELREHERRRRESLRKLKELWAIRHSRLDDEDTCWDIAITIDQRLKAWGVKTKGVTFNRSEASRDGYVLVYVMLADEWQSEFENLSNRSQAELQAHVTQLTTDALERRALWGYGFPAGIEVAIKHKWFGQEIKGNVSFALADAALQSLTLEGRRLLRSGGR